MIPDYRSTEHPEGAIVARAALNLGCSPDAVRIAVIAYYDVGERWPDDPPAPHLAEQLEQPEDVLMEMVVEYVMIAAGFYDAA